MIGYVRRELVRNPRRTLASLVGVILGVGLFSGVLFFIDGSGASMTKRAIAPLALDQQLVLPSTLGAGVRLTERISGPRALRSGQSARIVLNVENRGSAPVNEVVVDAEPPPPLSYVHGTTRRAGGRLADVGGQSRLARGLARTGINIGTLRPRARVQLSYRVRARRAVPAVGALRFRGKASSRENPAPVRANAPAPRTPDQLARAIGRIPGVSAVDQLSFVDLPPRSLRAGGRRINNPVRVFGFGGDYQRHHQSIRITAGSLRPGTATLSAEASRALAARPGEKIQLLLPAGRRTPLPVGALADLSRAKPLFYSRKSSKLEEFLYVPNTIVLDRATFDRVVLPAFRAASARRGAGVLKSLPLQELDVVVDRSKLRSDPAGALAETRAVARSINRVAPGQGYLIDNISNALQVARDDARVAKRMFLFLGLPGVLLAAFLVAYAGGILARAQRREQATLRVHGAHVGHLRRLLAYRTLALAGIGSIAGSLLGFLSVMAVLGRTTLLEASAGALARSGLAAAVIGMLVTAAALYVPGRRSLRREISEERAELSPARVPRWRRLRLDYVLLAAAALAEVIALRSGAFDAPPGSVYEGRAVSLPSYLLLAPLVAWFGGTFLAVRVFETLASRFPLPPAPRFGSLVGGTLRRSVRRRSWALATGVLGVGLVVAFGTSLLIFAATYDGAKAADSRFVVGSDIRVTPSVLSPRAHPASYSSKLRVAGVSGATPVVFKLENSVLFGREDQGHQDLAAIQPASFERVAALSKSFFVDRSARDAMAALEADPRGLLVSKQAAEDLSIERGDRVRVLLARGTKRQKLAELRVVGLFKRFPGFPEGVGLVANLRGYTALTRSPRADFFLAGTSDRGRPALDRAVAALRSGPGSRDQIEIETTRTALDKDQSSLTALNVHGLVDLDVLYTLLMSAAAVAIFVFGLMLQRRREYVTLRAQGMHPGELRALVLGEAAVVAVCGLVSGIAVGTGMAYLLVHVLRPLFVLDPVEVLPVADVATLATLALAATAASALTGTAILRRLKPMELLREP